MSMWLMYLVVRLDALKYDFGTLGAILMVILISGGLALVISYIPTSICREKDARCACYLTNIFPKLLKIFKLLGAIWLILTLLVMCLPTTKQAAAIYFVPKVINNKQVRKMPDKLVTLANDWIDEQIKSIKGNEK